MTDDLLKNTLTGITSQAPQTAILPKLPKTPKALTVPTPVTDNRAYIGTLAAAQKQPNAIMNLQRVMQLSSRVAYNQRQAKEMEITGRQFDPTKVSGGTFASIIGNLETRRGTDISKIYASTMETYQTVQQEITRRLEKLQEAEESKRRWEAEMEQKKEEYEYMKEKDKEEAKRLKEEMEEDKRQFELGYAKSSSGAAGYTPGFFEGMIGDFTNVTIGEDGKPDPFELQSWMENAGSQVQSSKDHSDFTTTINKVLEKFGIFSGNKEP